MIALNRLEDYGNRVVEKGRFVRGANSILERYMIPGTMLLEVRG